MKSEPVLVRKLAVAGVVSLQLLAGCGGGTSPSSMSITTESVDPQSIALDSNGKFAYVMDGGSDGSGGYVSMYTINPTTGALASIGPPVSTYGYGVSAGSVAVDPLGRFAYVTNSGDVFDYGDGADGTVAMYAINATTGALTSTGTINGNCPGLCLPSSVVVDPSGRLAYVANGGGGAPFNVAMYTINAATGVLTPTGTIATGVAPTSIAIHPSGKFAYVTNSGSNSVSMYGIDSATGTLTLIGTIGT